MDVNRVYNLIKAYKVHLIILGIIVLFTYLIIANFYGVFSVYNCLTTDFIWKISNGKLSNCFKGDPKECKHLDKYGSYGFCYDLDYYGTGMGQKEGSYGYNCLDWIFDPKDCYPETCELANTTKKYGWCVEKNRAYLGNVCGPSDKYGVRCNKWIWTTPEKCPRKCPIVPESSKRLTKKIVQKKSEVRPAKTMKVCPKVDDCICE